MCACVGWSLASASVPLFPGSFPLRDFSLVENRTYSKGLIALRYKRARSRVKGLGRAAGAPD